MKKLFLTLITTLPLFSQQLFAEVVMTRTKTQCIPGCNTVTREPDKYAVLDENGEIIDWVYTLIINCTGWGIASCPNNMKAPGEEMDPFTATNGQILFDHALNQISLGTINGSHSTTYLNTVTGKLYRFTAIWTTNNGIESITVTKEFLY